MHPILNILDLFLVTFGNYNKVFHFTWMPDSATWASISVRPVTFMTCKNINIVRAKSKRRESSDFLNLQYSLAKYLAHRNGCIITVPLQLDVCF